MGPFQVDVRSHNAISQVNELVCDHPEPAFAVGEDFP
jgi:hypothetical protein